MNEENDFISGTYSTYVIKPTICMYVCTSRRARIKIAVKDMKDFR